MSTVLSTGREEAFPFSVFCPYVRGETQGTTYQAPCLPAPHSPVKNIAYALRTGSSHLPSPASGSKEGANGPHRDPFPEMAKRKRLSYAISAGMTCRAGRGQRGLTQCFAAGRAEDSAFPRRRGHSCAGALLTCNRNTLPVCTFIRSLPPAHSVFDRARKGRRTIYQKRE